jgi:hypothetical protein
MNCFSWLLVGHLVGDWLLQNNWMAKGKTRSFFTRAGIVHFSIYTATLLGALWLSGMRDEGPLFYLGFGAIIFASHWLIDATNAAKYWISFYHQTNIELMRVAVDQVFHLLVLVLLTTFLCGQ